MYKQKNPRFESTPWETPVVMVVRSCRKSQVVSILKHTTSTEDLSFNKWSEFGGGLVFHFRS